VASVNSSARQPPSPVPGRQPRAVRNALEVLAEVVAAGPGITARQISSALRLPRATTYRMLNLLVAEEYLVRLPDLRGFALGARAALLSVPVVPVPSTAARAVVAHLRSRVRWGVHLAWYAQGQLTLVDRDPDHPSSPDELLARHPHASAVGKLLLAETPDRIFERAELSRLTSSTICEPARLRVELTSVAETGLARQCGEVRPSVGCLAVPIRAPADGILVAGLAVSGPEHRVAEPNREILDLLKDHAEKLAPLLA
jgi:DNA-binding IclR family transcriptional regulator